jgi:hypothetical protein
LLKFSYIAQHGSPSFRLLPRLPREIVEESLATERAGGVGKPYAPFGKDITEIPDMCPGGG